MLKLVTNELKFFQKNTLDGLFSEFIMFNTSNTNFYSKKSKLQAILKNGIREPKRNHHYIIDKNDLISCCIFGYRKMCTKCGSNIDVPIYCRDKNLCAICNARYSNKRGQKAYETFDLFGTEYMIHDVLTIPAGYFSKELDKFAIMNECYRLALLFVRKTYGIKASGVDKVHTNSTKDPLGRPHFHIHILISDKKYYTISQKTLSGSEYDVGFGKKKNIKVYQDVQKLRDTWRKILGYHSEVNFYHQYSNKPAKKRHWCKYICRDSIYDINEFLLKNGDNYQLSPGELKNYAYQIQNKPYFKKIRWFGEYSCSKRADLYYNMYQKNIENAYKKINYIEVCPQCGEKLPEESGEMFLEFVKITKDSKLPIIIDEEEYEFYIKRLKK
ncbi:hypothetical protein ES708_25546 [subsurface metagenome]